MERLRQVVKEVEKKQMEARSRNRLHYAKNFHDKNELLSRRERKLKDTRELVEMLPGDPARYGAAPGGSWSRAAPLANQGPAWRGREVRESGAARHSGRGQG